MSARSQRVDRVVVSGTIASARARGDREHHGSGLERNNARPVLAEHEAVAAAYAVGVPDPSRGESVGVFVVPKRDVEPHVLVAWCRERLASYKVPRFVWLRREHELPQKGSGKADKTALRAEAERLTAETRPI